MMSSFWASAKKNQSSTSQFSIQTLLFFSIACYAPSVFPLLHKRFLPRAILLGITLICTALLLWPKPPSFEGKPISKWFRDYCESSSPLCSRLSDPPMNALRALGPNAIPFLTAQIRRHDTPLIRVYRNCSVLLPHKLRDILPPATDRDKIRAEALMVLSALSENGREAIPDVISMLRLESADSIPFQLGLDILRASETAPETFDSLIQDFCHSGHIKEAKLMITTLDLKTPLAKKTLEREADRGYLAVQTQTSEWLDIAGLF
jgi:hypothetical protein